MPLIKKAVASAVSIPAPIGGWNARDSIADMDENDAVTLINFFPQTSDVLVRKGYTRNVTGMPSQTESLLVYASPTSQKMFAASGTAFYDVSSSGAVGASVVSGLTNARWQEVNVATAGGNFLLAVNGSDKLRGYDGTNWYTDGDGSHDITGVDSATLIDVNTHKERVWFVQKDSLKAWYLGTKAISGAATAFPLQSIAQFGGYLVTMATWTVDAGFGADDLAVFITSQGEVIVYRGTDPSSASTWALVGVWQLAAPIGRRCFMKYAGDLLLITQDGVVPMSGELQSSRTNPRVALTDKINSAMTSAATLYGSKFGWELVYYPKASLLMLNVPVNEGSSQEQYAMNSITKAWGQFQGMNANCWAIFQDELYFGSSNFVGKAWSSFSDNSTNINASGKQAFNYFKKRGLNKRFTLMRPILLTNGQPSTAVGLDIDFVDTSSLGVLSFTPSTSAIWDTAVWDTSVWGGSLSVSKAWQGAQGIGFAAAPRLQIASNGIEVHWVSTDVVFEYGGIL